MLKCQHTLRKVVVKLTDSKACHEGISFLVLKAIKETSDADSFDSAIQ